MHRWDGLYKHLPQGKSSHGEKSSDVAVTVHLYSSDDPPSSLNILSKDHHCIGAWLMHLQLQNAILFLKFFVWANFKTFTKFILQTFSASLYFIAIYIHTVHYFCSSLSPPPSFSVPFSVPLQARDGGDLAVSASIIITVADINDHTPAFQGPFARTIPENFTLVDTVRMRVQPRGSL